MGGMLGAFLRGAAGPGLLEVGRTLERRDERADAAKQRAAEREDDQRFRIQMAEVNAKLSLGTARQARIEDDEFKNDPARMERDRKNRTADIQAEAGVRSTAALDAERARAKDTDLNQALTNNEVERSKAAAKAKMDLERDETLARGTDKAYLGALRAMQLASTAPDRTDYKGRDLDNAIKQMAVDNAKRVNTLKTEFATATPERKRQISDEVSILTGKDTDNFVPVPIKDEAGVITGYKVFDKKRGVLADDSSQGAVGDPIKDAMDAKRAAAAAGAAGKKDGPANGSKADGRPAVAAEPVDRIGNGPIGMLTPRWMLEESARAGNKRAQQALRVLQEGESRPAIASHPGA